MRSKELNSKDQKAKNNEDNNIAFLTLLIGMLLGLMIGGLIFFNLDKTKWPNPYGWWFTATFISTVLGAILGFLLYTNTIRKNRA